MRHKKICIGAATFIHPHLDSESMLNSSNKNLKEYFKPFCENTPVAKGRLRFILSNGVIFFL